MFAMLTVMLVVFVLARLGEAAPLLGLVSMAGSGFVFWLGLEAWRARTGERSGSALSNPVVRGWQANRIDALLFLAGFYLFLVGTKVLVAVAASGGRDILHGKGYGIIMRALSVILVLMAFFLAWEAFELLGFVRAAP